MKGIIIASRLLQVTGCISTQVVLSLTLGSKNRSMHHIVTSGGRQLKFEYTSQPDTETPTKGDQPYSAYNTNKPD